MTRGFPVLFGFVLIAGLGALDWATEGFRVVTSEGARAVSIARHPRAVPDVTLVDQDGRAFSLADYRGRKVLINFIYASCPRICGLRGDAFSRALAQLPAAKGTEFLSISFDPRDDRGALELYADRYGAKAPRWRVARAFDASGLAELLTAFGVVAIPDGLGGYIHDGSIYVVDPRGRLAQVVDLEGPLLIKALRS